MLGTMNDEPKHVMVTLTTDLATRSLAAANDAGMSRSELVRRLLVGYLAQNGSTND
jgi:metal-responsive CopG/Arc/MetJ family transcriptional regulator